MIMEYLELKNRINEASTDVKRLKETALQIVKELTDKINELENGYITDLEEELEEKTQQLLDFQTEQKKDFDVQMLYEKTIRQNRDLQRLLENCLGANKKLTETLEQQKKLMEAEQ